jgi:hypothetical protein
LLTTQKIHFEIVSSTIATNQQAILPNVAETFSDISVNDNIEVTKVKTPSGKGDAQSSDSEEFSRRPTGLEDIDIE